MNFLKSNIYGVNLNDDFPEGTILFLACSTTVLPVKFHGFLASENQSKCAYQRSCVNWE